MAAGKSAGGDIQRRTVKIWHLIIILFCSRTETSPDIKAILCVIMIIIGDLEVRGHSGVFFVPHSIKMQILFFLLFKYMVSSAVTFQKDIL